MDIASAVSGMNSARSRMVSSSSIRCLRSWSHCALTTLAYEMSENAARTEVQSKAAAPPARMAICREIEDGDDDGDDDDDDDDDDGDDDDGGGENAIADP